MSASPSGPSLKARTIFISDVHLGFEGCSAERLLAFLGSIETRTLYLVGDILDLASGSMPWPETHCQVLREIAALASRGTRVIYIPGNHDDLLRSMHGMRAGRIEILHEAIHETADGRRFLVAHGDELEGSGATRPWLDALGGRAYGVLLGLNQKINTLGAPLGLPAYSIAGSLKQAVKASLKSAAFDRILCEEARRRGVDGVICGHTHHPEIVDLDGILYCNDGDWVESCTALVEDRSGQLSLVRWQERALAACAPDGTDASVDRAA